MKYKVRVFISSKCGGRFAVARKALRGLLMETNLTEVYVFECESASTKAARDSYLDKIDDSDLCVFLIDNAEGISPGVLEEHERALKRGKRSIYLFCDENEKRPTPLQTEVMEQDRATYEVVHEFSDLVERAYQAVMRDVVSIYHDYCVGRLVRPPVQYRGKGSPIQAVDSVVPDKRFLDGFDRTRNELVRAVFPSESEVSASSALDEYCSLLLRAVIGKSNISALDFDGLADLVGLLHQGPMRGFVLARMDALSAFFCNDLERCLLILSAAYDKAASSSAVPRWLKNDLLVDMRYIQYLVDEANSRLTLRNRAEILLDESTERVYYPLVDRYTSNLYSNLLKKHHMDMLSSPYSTHFWACSEEFESLAAGFIVAVLHGSLTHVLLTREHLAECLTALCFIYPHNHAMYVELLKLLLLCQKDKEIGDVTRAYNQTTDTLTESDIDYMLTAVNMIPLPHKRLISQCILVKHFGGYMSDHRFKEVFDHLSGEFRRWVADEKRVFSVSTHLFEAVQSSIERIDSDVTVDLALAIYEHRLSRWYDEALQVIFRADLSSIPLDAQNKVVDFLRTIVEDDRLRENCGWLERALMSARRQIRLASALLDPVVQKHMPDFFATDYTLMSLPEDADDALKHIPRLVQRIHQQNQEQGRNGTYHWYSDDPYQLIQAIVKCAGAHLEWTIAEPVVAAIEETILAPNQTIEAKVSAIRLAMCLASAPKTASKLLQYIEKWLGRQEEILRGHQDYILSKASLASLEFSLLMMRVCSGRYDPADLVSGLASAAQLEEYQVISSLETIEALLRDRDLYKMDALTLSMFMQYVIGMSSHKSLYVRMHAAKLLVLLCRSRFQSIALARMSRMMDSDSYQVKATILGGLQRLGDVNQEMVNYIRLKGLADNHFLVRKLAARIPTVGC